MASIYILKIKICLKPLKPLFHQGRSAFSALNTSLYKSPQFPLSARFLCTRDTNPNSRGRQKDRRNSGRTDEHWGVKNRTVRCREEELWGGSMNGRGKSSTHWQLHSTGQSVFHAGTAKRTTEMLKRRASLVSLDEEPEKTIHKAAAWRQLPDRPLSVAEWRELKESQGNSQNFEKNVMCTLTKTNADLEIAKSLLTFVAVESGTLSYELLLRYLTLCVLGGHDTEVFDIYDIMQGRFPSLESGAASLFIKSFSRTERWREAITILRNLDKLFAPTSRNYVEIIAAAVSNGDLTTAWAFYNELIEKGLSPQQKAWESLFKVRRETSEAEAMSQSEQHERLLQVLLYMRNNQIYPQHDLARNIKTWFERGLCRCCGSELESIQLTAEEYQQLKDRLLTDIIEGRDIFKKTTPAELERFKMFVKRSPAFDVVIDGLNVAHMSIDKSKKSENLLAVVSKLQSQGLNVLVLGRKHMLRPSRSWQRQHMIDIQNKAYCFFTDDISEDDPFLLYAALHSGNHCQFVSKDLMRNHKACLLDEASRRLFFKWQRGHQLVVHGKVSPGRVLFQSISSYDTIVQNSADSWHVPYDDTEDRSSHEVPQRWLCLTTRH